MESIKKIEIYINILGASLSKLLKQSKSIERVSNLINDANTIFICGNGGSSATASHFAEDLMLMCKKRAYCLSDNIPNITAISNDKSYDDVFKDQLEILSKKGDTLIVITGSGNSKNILNAVSYALDNKIGVIALVGMDGGKLLKEYNQKIDFIHVGVGMQHSEDLHLIISHIISILNQK